MKRYISATLAFCLAVLLAACGGTASSASGAEAGAENSDAVTASLCAIPECMDGAKTVTLCDGQDNVWVTYTLTYDESGRWTSTDIVSADGSEQTIENRPGESGNRIGGIYTLLPDLLDLADFNPEYLADMTFSYDESGALAGFSDGETAWTRACNEDGSVTVEENDSVGRVYEYSEGTVTVTAYDIGGTYGEYVEYELDGHGNVVTETCRGQGTVTAEGTTPGEVLRYAAREYDSASRLVSRAVYEGGTLWGTYRVEY